jgi:polysaccharide deacetylase 2 family uncharacterized protein YibQ
VLAAVAVVILWPARREPVPSEPAEPAVSAPTELSALVSRYLADRRLEVVTQDGGGDLLCKVPPGWSLFALNGELARAMRYLGGRIEEGREQTDRSGKRWVDLRLARSGESCKLRLRTVPPPGGNGQVALVIDDFGYQTQKAIDSFLSLPFPFTPAVLPGYARSDWTVRRSLECARRPILHLPMEPMDRLKNDPGPGALLVGMTPEEIRGLVTSHLTDLEGVVGVNHHMGSRACAEAALVGPALDVLAEKGLYYLDSATSAASVCPMEAVLRGVRCLRADLFLDGESPATQQTRRDRLREACSLARANGTAILIGHARSATLQFLESAADSASAWGCRFVPIDSLLR